MDLDNIAVLVEAVQAGSLAAAARRLSITPMAASRRLTALEEELGSRLVHRTTRALSLTPEGEAFLPHAQAMLEHEADAREALRPSSAGVSGMLRITASAPFGRKVVAPMIPAFLDANLQLRVDLLMTDSIVDIVAEGIDVAIRIAQLRDNTLIARRLGDNPRWLYATPDYVTRHGAPKRMADLAAHECLSVTGTSHWPFIDKAGKPVRQRVTGRFSASSLEAIHEACLGGFGIMKLSAWNADPDVEAGRLVRLTLEDADIEPMGIWAVYPSARLVPPKVRAFIGALARHLDPDAANRP